MAAVWLIAYYSVKNDYIVPPLGETLRQAGILLISGTFWLSCLATFGRALLAFLISFIAAACLAVLCEVYKPLKAFIRPVVTFLRVVPTMAVVIIVLLSPNAVFAPVTVTVLVLFPKIYASLNAAAEGTDKELAEMAEVYNVSKKDRIFKIFLPQIAPEIVSQAGADISFGLKLSVSAEVLCHTAVSLGGMMQDANMYNRIPEFFALTLIAVLIGFLIEILIAFLTSRLFKWRAEDE